MIGVGRRFAVFHVTEDYISEDGDLYPSSLSVVDLELKEIFITSPVIHERYFAIVWYLIMMCCTTIL
jgi:hypothetical protein